MKILVAALWTLDTLHAFFICHYLYYYLITNYGVPTSLEYMVWFACLPTSRLLATDKIWQVAASIASDGCVWLQILLIFMAQSLTFINRMLLASSHIKYIIPSGTRNHNLIQAFLPRLVEIAELVMTILHQDAWAMGFAFIIGKLYTNSVLASLNTREYLRSLGSSSGTVPDLQMSTIHFANLPKPSEDVENSKNGENDVDGRDMTVIDITAVATLDKTAALRREAEV
ncbi:hypothetical protein M404DRAFT_22160 [Pisolithus tinctorius Marx 270]|uniref:Uncharacterized protein n=1 Tax=Pisolithus tinctorius Marx 270 TaxID=870435 RepID=A0A0C3JKQ2_PISTI|nr:hypothetical protein M404DRAFT_22160 [Pisolithus tinctorius Marx 270]